MAAQFVRAQRIPGHPVSLFPVQNGQHRPQYRRELTQGSQQRSFPSMIQLEYIWCPLGATTLTAGPGVLLVRDEEQPGRWRAMWVSDPNKRATAAPHWRSTALSKLRIRCAQDGRKVTRLPQDCSRYCLSRDNNHGHFIS
jgi:hypothetical protein